MKQFFTLCVLSLLLATALPAYGDIARPKPSPHKIQDRAAHQSHDRSRQQSLRSTLADFAKQFAGTACRAGRRAAERVDGPKHRAQFDANDAGRRFHVSVARICRRLAGALRADAEPEGNCGFADGNRGDWRRCNHCTCECRPAEFLLLAQAAAKPE